MGWQWRYNQAEGTLFTKLEYKGNTLPVLEAPKTNKDERLFLVLVRCWLTLLPYGTHSMQELRTINWIGKSFRSLKTKLLVINNDLESNVFNHWITREQQKIALVILNPKRSWKVIKYYIMPIVIPRKVVQHCPTSAGYLLLLGFV